MEAARALPVLVAASLLAASPEPAASQAPALPELVGELARLLRSPGEDALAHAVAVAKAATPWRSRLWSGPFAAPPSEGSSPELLRAIEAYPEPVRGALADTIAAFLGFEAATRAAFARQGPGTMPDFRPVFAARERLLDAALHLRDALAVAGDVQAACAPVQVLPVLSIDLSDCDNSYTEEVALQIDRGGNDTYLNHAGGGCFFKAAALLDFGGDDAYGDPLRPADCGRNGGGHFGTGFLLDAAGRDVYAGHDQGVNGGGHSGAGFLLDVGQADDQYLAGRSGTNGGGDVGTGFLFDDGGNETYVARGGATNGGGDAGTGTLLDAWGNDRYDAGASATNGGGLAAGFGLLLDASGDDSYTAEHRATNGGAYVGVGVLVDLAGLDAYLDANTPPGTGTDRSVAPKGPAGLQVDWPNGPS